MRDIFTILIISTFILSCIDRTAGPNDPGENVAMIMTSTSPTSDVSSSEDKKENYVPGEVLVRFAKDTDPDVIQAIQKKLHLQIIRKLSISDLYLMKIMDGASVEEIIIKLKDYKEVLYAEPNYINKLDDK